LTLNPGLGPALLAGADQDLGDYPAPDLVAVATPGAFPCPLAPKLEIVLLTSI
jgi:hypothetical protein